MLASTDLFIIHKGINHKGGNIIMGLGAKWRLHYFAHLDNINEDLGIFIASGEPMGTVGHSGNAANKPAHLHFSILTLLPMPWLIDTSTQGYKKAFYLDPVEYFE